VVAGGFALALLAWAGAFRVDADEFVVVESRVGLGLRKVETGLRWSIPLLTRRDRYPSQGVELPLPQAEALQLQARDGSRYGFRGWITVRARPESWRELHASSGGEGLPGVLRDAITESAGVYTLGEGRPSLTGSQVRDFERELGRQLLERGVDLRRLELDSIDLLRSVDNQSVARDDVKVLVIGLDGADWAVIDPLIEQGRLPHLRGLVDRGVRAKLLSISPMLSPVIWTSIATGVEPSRHGILDFLVDDPSGGARQPVTSAQRLSPAVWELLSAADVEVGVVGWWASWPADPVRGYMVSDRIAYQLFDWETDLDDAEGKTWPPELYGQLRDSMVTPESVGWDQVQPYLAGERKDASAYDEQERELLDEFRTLLASGETYRGIHRVLHADRPVRLQMVYFEGTDTVGHLFMPYRNPPLPGVDASGIESFGEIVDRYYETVDGYIGELLAERDESWTVMVVSDHGFASDSTRPQTTDSRIGHGAAADWHRRFGILLLSGAHVDPDARLEETSIYDVAPTLMALFGQPIPESWPGRVLAGALEADFFSRHPVLYRDDEPRRQEPRHQVGLDPSAQDLLVKLESLGYISAGGGDAGDSLTARNNAGVAFLSEGRYADAEEEFRQGLVVQPSAPMLIFNLGLAQRFQGKLDQARQQFRQAQGHETTRRIAGHQLAILDLADGDLESAEAEARRVLEFEPDAAEVRNTLGLILEQAGRIDEAWDAYLTASNLDPDAALARNNLGNISKRRGSLDDAERWYLAAIEADPYFMGAYNNLALVYQARGAVDRAIDLYGRALGKAPNNATVLNNLASLYYQVEELDRAREMWRRAVDADPAYPSPLNNLASLAIRDGDPLTAERLLRRALELEPGYGDAQMNLAIVLHGRGDRAGALDAMRKATEDPRTGANAWLQYGVLQLDGGTPESHAAAVEILVQASGIYPDRVELLNALGGAYQRSGQGPQALESWRRSLELQPQQPQLRQFVERLEAAETP